MSTRKSSLGIVLVLTVGAIAFLIIWRGLPHMRRPLDVVLLTAMGFGVALALAVANKVVKNAALVLVSLAFFLFALEMAQKYTGFLDFLEPAAGAAGVVDGPYGWHDAPSYWAARDRFVADGLAGDAFIEKWPGEIFTPEERTRLVVRTWGGATLNRVEEAFKTVIVARPDGGSELAPNNKIRWYTVDKVSGRTMFDSAALVDGFGFREPSGDVDAGEVYLFLGCSFTYGFGLNDVETLSGRFLEAMGGGIRVVNLGISTTGPHHSLLELERRSRLGGANIPPDRVKGVVFSLIDDHARRVVFPTKDGGPYYALENGRAVYKGSFTQTGSYGRLSMLLGRSRVYPLLRDRLAARMDAPGELDKWRVTHAVLAEMDRICRERYGVGLTVLYWGDDPAVIGGIDANGIDRLLVSDGLPADWADLKIKYLLYDGHPAAYANKLLGAYLADALRKRDAGVATAPKE